MAGEILTVDAGGFVKYAALSSAQLPASGVTAGTYGDATHSSQVTVDAAGRVTAASSVAITGGGGGGGSTEYDYVENTAGAFVVTATSEGSAQTYIAGNAVTYDGATRIKIEVWCCLASASGGTGVLSLFLDGTTTGWIVEVAAPNQPVYGVTFVTPTAAAHTYSIRAWKTGGTVFFTGKTRATAQELPAWYRITKA